MRHTPANILNGVIDKSHDFRASRIARFKFIALIRAQRRHAVADRAFTIANRLQDRLHPRLQAGQLIKAHLMHLVRRHGRRRARPQRPIIIGLALWLGPNTRIRIGLRRKGLMHFDLAVYCRADLLTGNSGGFIRIGPVQFRGEGANNAPALWRFRPRAAQLPQCFFHQEIRQDNAFISCDAGAFRFPVKLICIG